VLVHGRDRARGEAVVRGLENAELFVANFASLAEVRKLAAGAGPVELLVNNAGIGSAGGQREVSADGHELRFQVNYLASYMLCRLLPAPRIVNVSSIGQQAIDFDDVMLTKGYSGGRAYCQSKLAQVMMTMELAAERQEAVINALHPSTYMDTTMVRQAGITPMSTVETGADAILKLCLDEGRSGLFFDVLEESRADAQAYDAKARKKLMQLSRELTGA
jgi:NAD(P)-dependent dehydrogenase (short-subunit alcohol dehydrogenase family)